MVCASQHICVEIVTSQALLANELSLPTAAAQLPKPQRTVHPRKAPGLRELDVGPWNVARSQNCKTPPDARLDGLGVTWSVDVVLCIVLQQTKKEGYDQRSEEGSSEPCRTHPTSAQYWCGQNQVESRLGEMLLFQFFSWGQAVNYLKG